MSLLFYNHSTSLSDCILLQKADLTLCRKSALITEFVYKLHDMSPDTSIFWFGIDDLAATNPEDSSVRLNDLLESGKGPDCVLILDPGDQFNHFIGSSEDPLIAKLEEFKGSIIILARSIQDGSLLAGHHDICELHGLEVDASIHLLREYLGPRSLGKATEDQLIQVARSMAYSPRAIMQLASFLNNSGMLVSQLLDLYQKNEEISLHLFSREEARLKFDDTSILSRGIFNVKAFRQAHPEPSRILFQLYFLGGTSVPASLFASIAQLDIIIFTAILKSHFLLARTEDGNLTLHPLVYMAIKKYLEMNERKPDDPEFQEEKKWQEAIMTEFSKQYPGA